MYSALVVQSYFTERVLLFSKILVLETLLLGLISSLPTYLKEEKGVFLCILLAEGKPLLGNSSALYNSLPHAQSLQLVVTCKHITHPRFQFSSSSLTQVNERERTI